MIHCHRAIAVEIDPWCGQKMGASRTHVCLMGVKVHKGSDTLPDKACGIEGVCAVLLPQCGDCGGLPGISCGPIPGNKIKDSQSVLERLDALLQV
jgi:hypothetical protein